MENEAVSVLLSTGFYDIIIVVDISFLIGRALWITSG